MKYETKQLPVVRQEMMAVGNNQGYKSVMKSKHILK